MSHGTYKNKLLSTALLIAATPAMANITNGGFEQWTGNTPDAWTTIDSGINVSRSTNIINNANSAAAVNVTTGSQSNTDLLQQVSVEAGKTYDFSVDVYHTEGNIRARLYVDGYQGYSNQAQTNQWQTISHSYTPSSNKTINVGLRFYDMSGFDGNETVYVDNFLPNTDGGASGSCNDHSLTLTLNTDNYGSETSWVINNSQGSGIANGSGYASNTQYNEQVCLTDGTYSLVMSDSYGDGMCCNVGNGSYSLTYGSTELASGASFSSTDSTTFELGSGSGGDTGGGTNPTPTGYYVTTQGLSGYALKTELYNIIKNHSSQGYSAIWNFYDSSARDKYFENDNSILDMYSEKPNGSDSYTYTAVSDQCGTYNSEADCYNREHSFPKSWFGGTVEPMNSDVHHIYATDGYVNSKRSNFPFGEVASATFTSTNGSKLGSATSSLNYTGTVFEPIDEFKGDFARAYFYMATRYENVIGSWQNNTTASNAVLNGTSNQVFESWVVAMLLNWHNADPVSQMELDRNQAAFEFQGNRNPYIDHPEFVEMIW
ncbi:MULTISPECIES: endonuclease [unclassified Pseudoalteromonas]|uniref:endonuclease n=1 Tax=unclassified Pseudoalteromonas TaxID=194690 RepID=UPI0006D67A76|nr:MULTISPECIES: endonuclease [unclassified Pseudoalteromonas]KPZ53133.1 Extracellular ribonuclease precursor [Pseudoalteromonas sp. P1-13-1a]KPZ56026.1 Extracellular ribonuclease precursor [Pseudoalteromonas sp. P1-25]